MTKAKKTDANETPTTDEATPDKGVEQPTPDEEGFIGELSEQARLAIGTIQRQQGEILTQIGSLELRKAQLISNHNGLQEQAKRILDSEAVRMGIPKGKPWQVTPDGKARLVG